MENRIAMNKVDLVGVVKEHKLKKNQNEKEKKYINGSLIINCGDSEVTLKVFVSEKTKKKTDNKTYIVLEKFINEEFLTMAKSKDEAAVVTVRGNGDFTPRLKEELFVPEGTQQCKTSVGVDLGFGNIYVDEKNKISEEDFKATFDIELYIKEIEDEVKTVGEEEEETGRAIVKGYVPCFGGSVFPITIMTGIVKDEDGEFNFAEQIRENISEGESINLWGDINYLSRVEKIKKGGSLGKAKTEEKITYIHELVATGGEVLDSDDEFDEDVIAKAVKERDIQIKEKEDEALKGNKKNKGLKKDTNKEGKKERRRLNF
ncbi:MAG: hypothetical protein RR942_01375 [Romboutsia sp.]